jgi:acyl-homoserine-lactone acylase
MGDGIMVRRFVFVALFLALVLWTPVSLAGEPGTHPLSEQVEIRRDTWGVPHVLGETHEAAAFGYGYAAAEDHVLNIARLFIQARGEEAKHFGPDHVESDFGVKQFRVHQTAEARFGDLPPWTQDMFNGYAEGYNEYLDQHRDELPEWVQPVTGVDVLAHGRKVVLDFATDLRQIERIGEQQSAKRHPTDTGFYGSNMWAINKERSASANALLLGNPHLRWSGSHLWHEVHMTIPGEMNMYGATLIGFPGPSIGFNNYLGWSHTVNPHDSDDIYELTLNPRDHSQYWYEGSYRSMTSEVITVEVKTDDGIDTESREVWWSHYGPVVKTIGHKAYAFKSANMTEYRSAVQASLMGKARNLEEFRRAVDVQGLAMFNICYADVEGNSFYLFNGRFPQRPQGYDWSGVVPGDTADTEWYNVLRQGRLPSLLNPPGGYVQNCNSSPWYTNMQAVINRHEYPDDLAPLANTLRSQLSLQMLEKDGPIDLDYLLEKKFDHHLLLADRVKDDLITVLRGRESQGEDLDEAADVLAAWDNSVSPESVGSVLFVQFWNLYKEEASPEFDAPWSEDKPMSTPYGIGDERAARRCMAKAMKTLKQTAGSISVPWGMAFRLRKGDVDVPIGGLTTEFGAFRVVGYQAADDGRQVAIGGDSYVFAVEFSDPPRAYSIMAYSQSDDPDSPHYNDQCEMFAKGEWKPVFFTEADIAANLERSYRP